MWWNAISGPDLKISSIVRKLLQTPQISLLHVKKQQRAEKEPQNDRTEPGLKTIPSSSVMQVQKKLLLVAFLFGVRRLLGLNFDIFWGISDGVGCCWFEDLSVTLSQPHSRVNDIVVLVALWKKTLLLSFHFFLFLHFAFEKSPNVKDVLCAMSFPRQGENFRQFFLSLRNSFIHWEQQNTNRQEYQYPEGFLCSFSAGWSSWNDCWNSPVRPSH